VRSTPGQLADALTPRKLRRDGIRLGLVAVLSILYALVFEQAVLDIVLVALNGFGVLVAALALIVAALAIRRHGRAAAIALAVYGACLAGHLAAIVLLLRG
jgi:Na+/proline symporter